MKSDCVINPFHMIDHAKSLQQVANNLNMSMDKNIDTTLFHGMFIAVPVLMALAVEIALKALRCQEGKEFVQGHDLVELFQSLNENTQAGLNMRFPTIIDAVSSQLGVQEICPVGAGIEKGIYR